MSERSGTHAVSDNHRNVPEGLCRGYAIGAFNVNNMEIIQGITEAAQEVNSPLILQVSAGARKYAKPVYLRKLVEAAIEDTGLPMALHLDHGEDFKICKACIDGGFTSVMIDGSKHSFQDNIAPHPSGGGVRPRPRRGGGRGSWAVWPASRTT